MYKQGTTQMTDRNTYRNVGNYAPVVVNLEERVLLSSKLEGANKSI
jgi:hypothetical protein